MSNFNPVVLIFFVPVMDSWVFPWLRKRGHMPSPIKRMTIGFGLVTVAMIWATILQKIIYLSPPHYDHPGNRPNDVSIWWQVGPYVIVALSEIFTLVAAIEYAYNHAPRSMKTLLSSLNALPNALASLIVYALLPASKDPNLVVLYGIVSAISGVTTLGFYFLFRTWDREDIADNPRHR
jgi:proton-dependent oligopeptide transporter, POT family